MKLVILDRDGVINYDSDNYIKSPDEWLPIPGSLDAIARLHQAGYKIAIATNQSGIARGLYDENMLLRIHDKLMNEIKKRNGFVDAIFSCPHMPSDNCDCRKPKAGLLKKIEEYFNAPLLGVPMIGDSYRDIEAGHAVGCNPILVETGNGKKTLLEHPELYGNIAVFPDLRAAVDAMLLYQC